MNLPTCRYKFIDNTNNEYIVTEFGDVYSIKNNKYINCL